MSNYEICAENIRKHCKKNYVLEGKITSMNGVKKCRDTLREAGAWGRDKGGNCKQDPEQCNHTGCAFENETYSNGFARVINDVEPSLQSNVDVMKSKMKTSMNHIKAMKIPSVPKLPSFTTSVNGGMKNKTARKSRKRITKKSLKHKKSKRSTKRTKNTKKSTK